MTMMEDYMDKNVDQYCTFEANQFAMQDLSHTRPTEITLGGAGQFAAAMVPEVANESVDENFFYMDNPKGAFAVRAGTDHAMGS